MVLVNERVLYRRHNRGIIGLGISAETPYHSSAPVNQKFLKVPVNLTLCCSNPERLEQQPKSTPFLELDLRPGLDQRSVKWMLLRPGHYDL